MVVSVVDKVDMPATFQSGITWKQRPHAFVARCLNFSSRFGVRNRSAYAPRTLVQFSAPALSSSLEQQPSGSFDSCLLPCNIEDAQGKLCRLEQCISFIPSAHIGAIQAVKVMAEDGTLFLWSRQSD